MKLLAKKFSHIYIEYDVIDDPVSLDVISKFPNSNVIYINNYKEVFSRPHHSYSLQKSSPSIILSKRKRNFAYSGSKFSQNAGFKNFFYNTILLNCIYDCHYCYLQGLFPSAHLVCFTNLQDFFTNTTHLIRARSNLKEPFFLSLSYDTDLLAFESIYPFCRKWIEFASRTNNLIVEIRTKSNNFQSLIDIASIPNVLFSWSLSPDIIAQKYEVGAPKPTSRLSSLQQAIQNGWKVRLCFDPIIAIPDWPAIYANYFHHLFQQLDPNSIYDVTLGSFRMSSQHLKQARKHRPDLSILQRNWNVQQGVASYSKTKRREISSFLLEKLSQWFKPHQISIWH